LEDGKNGFVVKMKDFDDLTDKIEKFINLPHEEKVQMGLNARKKVEREFDRQIVVEKYIGELNS
jgi:galacturonosyltransferase